MRVSLKFEKIDHNHHPRESFLHQRMTRSNLSNQVGHGKTRKFFGVPEDGLRYSTECYRDFFLDPALVPFMSRSVALLEELAVALGWQQWKVKHYIFYYDIWYPPINQKLSKLLDEHMGLKLEMCFGSV